MYVMLKTIVYLRFPVPEILDNVLKIVSLRATDILLLSVESRYGNLSNYMILIAL